MKHNEDTHVGGKLPYYFHRYLESSYENIIICMGKHMVSQDILITSMEGIMFYNGLAFRSCHELNEGTSFFLYSMAIWVQKKHTKYPTDQCVGPC